MSWINKRTGVPYYGLEYMHPTEDDPYIFEMDYLFTGYSEEAVEFFQRIIQALRRRYSDLTCGEVFDYHERDGYQADVFFTCKPSTYTHIDYIMDAYTDGWGYAFETFN